MKLNCFSHRDQQNPVGVCVGFSFIIPAIKKKFSPLVLINFN